MILLKDYLNSKREAIDSVLEKFLDELIAPKVITEGMKYSVLNGGKRIRPILVLMTLELLNKDSRLGLATGAAIEMIHSYSLVHDDLPALDNDDYRRGKLTTHKKFGEAEGILIGDSLLTEAFKIISEKNEKISFEKIVKIIALTSDYSGARGMIGGQMIDIESEGKKVDIEILRYIHSNKTGKLIKLPVEVGAIIGDAKPEEKEALIRYAELIGLAFQIQDDILDIEGDFEKTGKKIGSDVALEKSTYPALIGLAKSKELLNKTTVEAKKILIECFGEKRSEKFIELTDYIACRES
ncbi:MAG: polyprenyl synthetase family protein [Cetobacterium sp.]|uniref:polyprenyl synthetase family protein n=1 Tax=Cetobacterium sp. TaxID=2071632 RepID=UPI002FC7A09A